MNEGETVNLPFLPPIGQLFEGRSPLLNAADAAHAVGVASGEAETINTYKARRELPGKSEILGAHGLPCMNDDLQWQRERVFS